MSIFLAYAHQAIHSPAGVGALGGFLAAIRVDYVAFKAWHTWHDFQSYSWGTASFRWVQGGVIGAISALGVAALL